MENVLLIGLGYHARRVYFPVLQDLQKKNVVGQIFIVDLKSQEKIIKNYLLEKKCSRCQALFLSKPQNKKLNTNIEKELNSIIQKNKIKGVIISTEPLAHMVYAKWAIKKRLSILMDKPISTHEWIICNEKYGKQLLNDYNELLRMYQRAKKDNPRMVLVIMAQRRFHPLFRKMKEKIREIN